MPRWTALLALAATGCLFNRDAYDARVAQLTDEDGDGIARADDCDDGDPTAHPGADEVVADGVDQDCDGGDTCYADADGDGFGGDATVASAGLACDAAGEAPDADDCDDGDDAAFPGAPETFYDGVDQNCLPADDDDADGDGYPAYERGGTDCDDSDDALHPGLLRTFEVPSEAFPTIQSAIDAACDGDTIHLAEQVYEESIDLGRRDITLLSDGWASLRGAPGDAGPVVRMSRGALADLWVEQHASTSDGGCILVEDGRDVYVGASTSGCTTTGNGGAIAVRNTDGFVLHSWHVENAADGDGGALYVVDSTGVVFDAAAIYGNVAGGRGGGAYVERVADVAFPLGETLLYGTTNFDGNVAADGGGGLYLADVTGIDSDLVVFANNRSDGLGSSAALVGASSGRVRSWAVLESFGEGQAALYLQGELDLGNLFVVGSEGAGIHVRPNAGDAVRLANLLLLGNTNAGLVVQSDAAGTLAIVNAIVAFNGGYGLLSTGTARPDVSYSDLYDNAAGNYSGMSDLTGIEGNLAVDPGFLQYPSTLDVSPFVFLLAPDSALIDAGHPDLLDPDGSRSDLGMWAGPDAVLFEAYEDADDDGMYDGWEANYGLDTGADDAGEDNDGDTLTNAEEFLEGTSPSSYDTDADGAPDPNELDLGTSPIDRTDTVDLCPAPTDGKLRAAALAATGTVGWDQLRVNETPFGPGFFLAGEYYCTGLFAHAPSTVTITVPDGCTTLESSVGFVEYGSPCGDGAVFRVRQGDVTLWESATVHERDPAVTTGPVAVAPGAVDLVVDPLGTIACDATAWLELAVTCP